MRQINDELSRGDVLLNLLLKTKDNIKAKGTLSCSNCEAVEFKIL